MLGDKFFINVTDKMNHLYMINNMASTYFFSRTSNLIPQLIIHKNILAIYNNYSPLHYLTKLNYNHDLGFFKCSTIKVTHSN